MRITIMDANGSTLLQGDDDKKTAKHILRIVGKAGQTVVDGFSDEGYPFGWFVNREGQKFPFQMG